METGVIMRDQANLEKKSHLVPCRLSVEAIGLSVHPNDTPVPIE